MKKNYSQYFKNVLNEEMGIPSMDRNPDDVQFSDDLKPELRSQFEVPSDVTGGEVGFPEKNLERDVQELNGVISKVRSIAKELQALPDSLTQLDRSFKGIGTIAEDVAKAFAACEAIATNLSVYSIKLPSQKVKDQKEAEKQNKSAQSQNQIG